MCSTAANGGEAWELFLGQKGDFDALKVLFVSGYTKDSLFSEQTFDKGTQFLEKPFTRVTILSKVARVLANR